jgi:hypothetical protein
LGFGGLVGANFHLKAGYYCSYSMSELAAVVEQLIEMPSFKLFSLDYTVSLFSEERLKHF